MFEWLWKNKEWIFSGCGVSVLGIVFLAFRNRSSHKLNSQQLSSMPNGTSPSGAKVYDTVLASGSHRIETKPSGNEIAVTVDKSPPYQTAQIGANYVGLVVSWPIIFIDLVMLDQKRCALTLAYGTETWGARIRVTVDINDYPRLKTAHTPDFFNPQDKSRILHGWIEGRIVECRYGGMTIEPTKLDFFN